MPTLPPPTMTTRRHVLSLFAAGALPALAGCSTPLPLAAPVPAGADPEATRWLRESAEAHGWEAYRGLTDINVAYDGEWRPLIDRIQPEVVDKGYRKSSEERLLPGARWMAQAHRGPAGRKQVLRRAGRSADDAGEVAVWYDGRPSNAATARTAAAMVADCYGLFLLGPLWLAGRTAAPGTPLRLGERVQVDGRECQWLEAWLRPGLGLSRLDRVAIAVDRDDRTTRRMRFTLEGFEGTRGAVAEVDTFEHQRRHGVLWPLRSYERVLHPLPDFPAHDWRLTGLDVNRGYGPAALEGPEFSGPAAAPARPL